MVRMDLLSRLGIERMSLFTASSTAAINLIPLEIVTPAIAGYRNVDSDLALSGAITGLLFFSWFSFFCAVLGISWRFGLNIKSGCPYLAKDKHRSLERRTPTRTTAKQRCKGTKNPHFLKKTVLSLALQI